MTRPNFITEEDITRWSDNIDNDPNVNGKSLHPILREVCFAGLYLAEELDKLHCPDHLITQLQFEAGRLSFGRDPWNVSVLLLEKYKNNEIIIENNGNEALN